MKKAVISFFMISLLLLASCSLTLGGRLVGTWAMDSDPTTTITFNKDGTCLTSSGDSGTWSLDENNMLTITTSGSSTVLVFRIYIIDNTMIWTAGGAGITLTRVE